MYIAIFVVALIAVIMFHEFGHFATAKLFGMKVDRFFLGFGPTLWSMRRGETEYGVKAVPAGGFVRIVGMNEFEEIAEADRPRAFYSQAAWKRVIVLVAGSATHFVVAGVLLFAGLAFVGLPDDTQPATTDVAGVVDDSPAAAAGFEAGDRIIAVDEEPAGTFADVSAALEGRGGETLAVTVERGETTETLTATLASETPDGEPGAFLGVYAQPAIVPLPAGEALAGTVTGDYSIGRLTQVTVAGLGQIFTPEALGSWFSSVSSDAPRDLNGPVSVVGIADTVNAFGSGGDVFAVLILLAQLNVVLGVMNMLPLPPLDGGHVAVLAIEEGVNGVRRLRGRAPSWRLDPSVVTPVALAVILFFVVLSVTAIYADITNPISDALTG